jgi:hypothetical protein
MPEDCRHHGHHDVNILLNVLQDLYFYLILLGIEFNLVYLLIAQGDAPRWAFRQRDGARRLPLPQRPDPLPAGTMREALCCGVALRLTRHHRTSEARRCCTAAMIIS